MIPTMIFVGLIAGRWLAVPLGGVVWVVLVASSGACDLSCSPGAAFLGAVNTAAGVGGHKIAAVPLRQVWRLLARGRHAT